MRAGTLRHRVTLQSPTQSRDSVGGVTTTWTDEATVWAAVEPLQGREYWAAREKQATTSHRIRIRYRSDVSPTWRVSYDSRTFEIESVINVGERDRETHLICREDVT